MPQAILFSIAAVRPRLKSILCFGALSLALAIFAGYLFFRSNEPRHHGKTLHAWLDQLDNNGAGRGVTWAVLSPRMPRQIEAAQAIQAIGTNAIPFLLEDLRARDSKPFQAFEKFRDAVKQKIFKQPPYSSTDSTPAERIRWKAALGLHALGPESSSRLIPILRPLLSSGGDQSSTKEASFALAGMGPLGFAALTNVLESTIHSTEWGQICVIWTMGQHSSAATVDWVSVLLKVASRTNRLSSFDPLRHGAIWALGEIRLDPERTIPFLLEGLNDSQPMFRQGAAAALGKYGPAASNAVPLLIENLKDPNPWYVKEALKKIDPNWKRR